MPQLIDTEVILSENKEWTRLEEEWGIPIDLDNEEDDIPQKLSPVFSTLDLCKTTFDSSILLKKVRRKVGRQLSNKSTASVLDYKQFLHELKDKDKEGIALKQFYFISGQILSAFSVEEICDQIDDVFKSIEKLSSATSTIRLKKRKLPDVVQCSFSTTGLSFDDTVVEEREKSDSDDIDRYIDEAFNDINSTIVTLSNPNEIVSDNQNTSQETVTTLVRKFSSIINSPKIVRSPRKKRQCCDKFRELAEFWQSKACESEA